MSYPLLIQALVIEDDIGAKDNYDATFEPFVHQGIMAPPRYAFCYQDAINQLSQDIIFHLVIIDLRLPDSPGRPPAEGIDLGLAILDLCEHRDDYPIPALLIRSGFLGDADQGELTSRVATGFWHGAVLAKGDYLDRELGRALDTIKAYCEVGIHMRDAGDRQFPTLVPRDEDLLRRCVLSRQHTGVDLEWWAADYAHATGRFSQCAGWTKVLMGRFLLGGGMGSSLPTFFKFSPIGDAKGLHRSAEILSQKLSHIKTFGSLAVGSRCLLVTQKVGKGTNRPISMEDLLLGRKADWIDAHLPTIVKDLAGQVLQLGDSSPETKPISDLLWVKHDHVVDQWERWGDTIVLDDNEHLEDPVQTLSELQANREAVRYSYQSCLHGDLNITNIALDEFADEVEAYIFDAGWCCGGVNIRDLAMLEVTALLHQKQVPESLVCHCAGLYKPGVIIPQDFDLANGSDCIHNTFRFVAELRSQVINVVGDFRIYALMVFDIALMQLGGFYHQVSNNKIRDPHDAALLAALTATWLRSVAPEFVGQRDKELVSSSSGETDAMPFSKPTT